jgi:hypothetical protein
VKRLRLRSIAIAVGLVLLGWVAGRAQGVAEPDFEITVNAPEGETVIECVRGCNLQWVSRGLIPGVTPQRNFSYKCLNSPSGRCNSGRVGGWVQP